MLVVDRGEDFRGDFVGLEKMMEIALSVIFTTFAAAIFHHGRKIGFIFRVFNIDAAVQSIKRAVSRHAGRADAVESVAAVFGADKKIERFLTHAEEVARSIFRKDFIHGFEHFRHAVGSKDAADAEAVGVLGCGECSGLSAKVEEGAALDDGVEILFRLTVFACGSSEFLVFGDATGQPRVCAFHCFFHIFVIFGFREMVERHVDVGADLPLGAHRRFGRHFEFIAVDVGFKFRAFGGDFHIRQRKNLEAAGIGKSRAVPARKLGETAGGFNQLGARS